MAALEVRQEILAIAGALLEANRDDLQIQAGQVFVQGAPHKSFTFAQVAAAVAREHRPTGRLRTVQYFRTPARAFASGVHAIKLELDGDTGGVSVLDYVVAHDCGHVVNPMIVEGQVQGGLAHGLGNAFYEEFIYDDQAQPLTTSFMDYLLPTAMEIPPARVEHLEVACPLNPLGVKGAGEGGTIPAPAAFASALEDALSGRSVIREMPLSPEKIRRLVAGAVAPPGNAEFLT